VEAAAFSFALLQGKPDDQIKGTSSEKRCISKLHDVDVESARGKKRK
jgi:hypothetical protein